jgi:tRNA(adenine34) deaminase
MPRNNKKLENFTLAMRLALAEAEKARKKDEVPVGAVVIDGEGRILAKAHNQREKSFDPSAHAEILALRKAAHKSGNWRLENATLIVTLEPCMMCLAACVHARIDRVVFGAYDLKGGALSLGYNLHSDKRLNHRFAVVGGILQRDCARILSDFFREKRRQKK